MKIWCEVCDGEEASVFCTADEAALCGGCDLTVHTANKLASNHKRLSFVLTASSDSPLCDICQKNRAMLFCREDRAILCRNCDVSIHEVNEFTQKHNRFLLTGFELSSSSSASSQSPSVCSKTESKNRSSSVSHGFPGSSPSETTTQPLTTNLQEYLMESVPGWEVNEFLDHHYGY